MEEICLHWNWAPGSGFLNNSEFSLTWQLAQNTLPFFALNYKVGLVDMSSCPHCCSDLEEMAEHAFYYCERVCPFWNHVGERRVDSQHWTEAARGAQRWLHCRQHFASVSRWEVSGVSHNPCCSSNGDLDDAKEGLYDGANFSHHDPIFFLGHQLWVKIRCDRKRLDCIPFDRRWVHAASLVIRKGAMLESSFPPLPAHGDYGPAPSDPSPDK